MKYRGKKVRGRKRRGKYSLERKENRRRRGYDGELDKEREGKVNGTQRGRDGAEREKERERKVLDGGLLQK